jgi:hypothetical protein
MIAFATKKEERIKIMKLSEKPENAFSGESIPELTAITIAMIEAKKIDNTCVSTANMAHKKRIKSRQEGCENSQGGTINHAQSAKTRIPAESNILVIFAIFISIVIKRCV